MSKIEEIKDKLEESTCANCKRTGWVSNEPIEFFHRDRFFRVTKEHTLCEECITKRTQR